MKFSSLNKLTGSARPAPGAVAPKELPQAAPATAPRKETTAAAQTFRPSRNLRTPARPAAPEVPFAELDAQARKTYTRVLAQAVELLSRTEQPYTEQYEAIRRVCEQAAEVLKTNPVLLNYTAYSTSGGYLPGHTANTTLLAMAMGQAAGLGGGELNLLGFCAMAHDIGMTAYSHLYNSEVRLTEEEFAEMTLHTEEGIKKLDRIVDIDHKIKDRARRIMMQVHERLDGTGYPDRLSNEDIDPLAQFIGIADAYEALTHPRPWRDALAQPDAIKELLEKEGHGFNAKAIKALIGALSIYPPDSLVALSTKEIARVIKVNKNSLTRPLVEILLDEDFQETAPKKLDLMKYPLTSIERSVSLKELGNRNPGRAAQLELARWWTEW